MRRGLIWLSAISMLGVLASCGPSQATTPTSSPAPSVGIFTLSASACGYQGKDSIAAGSGSLAVANKSSKEAHFDFWRLDPGRQYAEFQAHIVEGHRRLQAREPMLGHPTFAKLSTSNTVPAGGSQSLAIPGAAGTYGMACISWSGGPIAMFAAGPVEISQ
jgi:hypothetical protein